MAEPGPLILIEFQSPGAGALAAPSSLESPPCESSLIEVNTTGATGGVAPTWRGLFGNSRSFTDGTTREADENYIIQSVLEPQSQVVQGFTTANMPVYNPTENRRLALVAYIRSLATEGQ